MDDAEIRRRLNEFINKIFYEIWSVEEARTLEKEIDAFCEENHVTFEQEQIFAESGAGEVLYMLTSAPDE